MQQTALFDLDIGVTAQVAAPPAPPVAAPPAAPVRVRPPWPRPVVTRPPTLLVVDGNSLLHRAFHAYAASGITASDGRPRGAVYGFLALLCGICEKVGPDGIVVGFDCGRVSWRRERHPAYKAQRPDRDPSLTLQLDDVACLLDRLGVSVVRPEGWEADDVLGSGAAAAEAAGWHAVLATSDRDAYGLLGPTTTVLRLGAGLDAAVEVSADGLVALVGVPAHQYVAFAALRGDTSDNLPGVAGLGPKRAADLLAAFASVEDAVADPIRCRSVLGRRAGTALLDDLAMGEASVYRRNVALMTIRRDLPVDVAATRPRLRPDQIERHLLIWELPTLVRRVTVAVGLRPDLPPPPTDDDAPPV